MRKKATPAVKKDFEKIKHKVGKRKQARNDTETTNGVTTRRVVVPIQNLEYGNVITEALTGLRHYNDKKRLDAVNSLARLGWNSIPEECLGDIIGSLGYCLSDDEAPVRKKCGSLLVVILTETNSATIKPFFSKVWLHVRSALANVKASIRVDGILFLKELLRIVRICDETEIIELLKALIELNSIILTNELVKRSGDANGKAGFSDFRFALWECIEKLVFALINNREEVNQGIIDAASWTVSAIVSREFSPKRLGISVPLQNFLVSLERNGEDVLLARLHAAAVSAGLLESAMPARSVDDKPGFKKAAKSRSSAFSELSRLMNSDSD